MKNKTKLTLEIGDNTVSWETDHIDTSLEELFDAFEGLLVTHTYPQGSIRQFIIDKGEELTEVYLKK